MACKVRYLSSAGIQRREVVGVQALADVFPSNWLMYVSLTAFPKYSSPIEIDVFLVMDDRIALLELKDWNGTLTHKGDVWLLNGAYKGRSPVVLANEKAKKIKGILKDQIPRLAHTYVDSRIVLTASATNEHLLEHEKPYVLSLAEAKSLVAPAERKRLLGPVNLSMIKPNMFVKELDGLLQGGRYFEPLRMSWDGFVVTDEDFYVHRKGVWREHRAQLAKEERVKAVLRLWRFDELPAGLNEPIGRRLVADRELGVTAFLGDRRSWLAGRGILKPTGAQPEEVLTQHHQLLSVEDGWTTLRRYLERNGTELSGVHRVDAMHTLVSLVAELHSQGVAHRDLGSDCVWLGSPTDMALTGFACAQLPDEESVSDWLDVLSTYAEPEPTGGPVPTARERDVRSLGIMFNEIARAEGDVSALPHGWQEIADRATAPTGRRYADAVELADALGELRNPSGPTVDQSRLDRFQTDSIPYVDWLPTTPLESNGRATRYASIGPNASRSVVKVWNGVLRGDTQRDHAILSMLEAASSIAAVPIAGVAQVASFGLSAVGPFIVTRFAEGETFDRLGQLGAKETLEVLESLIAAVTALHSRGLAHGDLHPRNVVVEFDGLRVTLIDVLDMPVLGDFTVRSPRYAPPNHERRSDVQIDRFAVCRMALDRASVTEDLTDVRQALEMELSRETIETLTPLVDALRTAKRNLTVAAAQVFRVAMPRAAATAIEPDEGRLWVRRFEFGEGLEVLLRHRRAAWGRAAHPGRRASWWRSLPHDLS